MSLSPQPEEVFICAICLSTLSDQLVSTPCGHVYHMECLKASYMSKADEQNYAPCPQCFQGYEDTDVINLYIQKNQQPVDELYQKIGKLTEEKITMKNKYKTKIQRMRQVEQDLVNYYSRAIFDMQRDVAQLKTDLEKLSARFEQSEENGGTFLLDKQKKRKTIRKAVKCPRSKK